MGRLELTADRFDRPLPQSPAALSHASLAQINRTLIGDIDPPTRDLANREMDFKTFVEFTLAIVYKHTPEALAYFFRLLDVQSCGKVI